ncbi:aminoacyl-tRNA hydrolase [Telmatocola sphagniphila]|uniref:Aminoacyl-tRNA hydrolase n=1 Tax=Telmatocola sphagniphila TaxID=1123043 RepID=A0A8E6BA85_9BACT|nr:alternative ribosome rescue aminoacyl-tRNA hydrolase ArfB [Telmatocola sphagniphila]QVL33423.1 aminoacyl-tRNA hydrolase [Telmatocola sphagniphila]
MLQINDQLRIPLEEFEWSYSRSGGPGGQNVNKVASKATLRWNFYASPSIPGPLRPRLQMKLANLLTTEGDLVLTSQLYRDQPRNREDCLTKFANILRRALIVEKPRKATKPTKGSVRRRLTDKKIQAARKKTRSEKSFED